MAHVYARGTTLWVKFYDNGKSVSKSLKLPDTADGRKNAEIIKKQIEADLQRGQWNFNVSKTKGIRLKQAIASFYRSKYNSEMFNDGTYYAAFKIALEQLGDFNVCTITDSQINRLKDYLQKNKSYATAVTYINMIRTLYNYLIKKGMYDKKNPIEKLKERLKPIVSIPDDDFNRILERIRSNGNTEAYRYIKFLRLTGFRVTEAITMKWEDIDFDNNIITVTNHKAKRFDIFPLYSELKEFLSEFRQHKGRLFTYKGRNSLKFWNRAMKMLNMDYCIHDIRRTFATGMAKKLMPYELKAVLRHQNIQTSMKYYVALDINRIGLKL